MAVSLMPLHHRSEITDRKTGITFDFLRSVEVAHEGAGTFLRILFNQL